MRLLRNSKYFSRDVPERDNNRNCFLFANSKLDFFKNHQEQRKSLKPFASLWSSEWYRPVCLEVGGNAEAGDSVEQIPFCVFFLIFLGPRAP